MQTANSDDGEHGAQRQLTPLHMEKHPAEKHIWLMELLQLCASPDRFTHCLHAWSLVNYDTTALLDNEDALPHQKLSAHLVDVLPPWHRLVSRAGERSVQLRTAILRAARIRLKGCAL